MRRPLLPKNLLRIMLLMVLVTASGCGAANWFVLTSNDTLASTPASSDVPYRDIWISADGVRLHGWYAAGLPSKPLILIFHGNSSNISDCTEYVRHFHASGFSVFLFDYRGYGVSWGESFGEDDLYEDARNVLSFLKRHGWRSDSIIYYGQSMGAAVALQMTLEQPPAGIVLESPFTSFHDIALFHSPAWYGLLGRFIIDIPFENAAKVGLLNAPLLIIHGEEDEVVPVEMSLHLFTRARTEKSLYLVRGGRHCEILSDGKGAIARVIARFAIAAAGG